MEAQVQTLFGSDAPADALDWRSAFAEVFAPQEHIADIGGAYNFGGTLAEAPKAGGFDIVLANPPYIKQQLIKQFKPALKRLYPDVYAGNADLYCYFYQRAIQILRRGGMLAFISSNKWIQAPYGSKLRAQVASACRIIRVIIYLT
jgi:methylase of polypeptide subunit release factors